MDELEPACFSVSGARRPQRLSTFGLSFIGGTLHWRRVQEDDVSVLAPAPVERCDDCGHVGGEAGVKRELLDGGGEGVDAEGEEVHEVL